MLNVLFNSFLTLASDKKAFLKITSKNYKTLNIINKIQLFIFLFGFSLSATSQTSIVLEKKGGVYLIPCKVNGLNMKFIFDTGASDVTISLTEALFMLKNGYLSKNDLIGTNYYQIANGDIQKGTKILIKRIEIGGKQLFNVQASIIHNSNAPLLLGQSALEKLGKFYFDYSKNALVILDVNSNNYGCVKGDCLNGFGTYTYKSGAKYVGNFIVGNFNGKGTYVYSNGVKYIGDFQKNNFNGNGTYIFSKGGRYIGEFQEGQFNGYGVLTDFDGNKYEGVFKEGLKNGNGTYIQTNGDKYIGEFQENEFNGKGTFVFANGDRYEGDFKDSVKSGNGIFTKSNGDNYIGGFKDGSFNGKGIISHSNGDKYEGDFKDGLQSGNGILTFSNGNKYVGGFKNGIFEGFATTTSKKGEIKFGLYKNGVLVSDK